MSELKIPPHSDEAEKSVLGSLLMDKDALIAVAEFLQPQHFYSENHGRIYEAMVELFQEREPVDIVTLSEKLRHKKCLKKIGGRSYLMELVESVPTAAHAANYGQIIKSLYTKRCLISLSSNLASLSFDEGKVAEEILEQAEKEIFNLSQQHLKRVFIPIRDALAESFDRLDELHKSKSGLRGTPTGFKDIDDILAGMQASNLLILASRPGIGKTSLALNIAQHCSVVEKLPVGFFSLEMSKEELVDRLLVAQADIDAWRLKTGNLNEDDFTKLSEAMGELAEAPLYIDDTPGLSMMEMRTKARRLQVEKGLKLLVVDYIQLVKGRQLENRVQEVSEISQNMKNLARELKVPVLALSQLSRAIEQRGTKIPQLADLRESGALEQDADVVMFLYREDEEDLENVTLSVAKHRNGPLRRMKLYFRGDRIKFYGAETKRK